MLNRPVKHLQNPRMRKHPGEQLVGVGPVVRVGLWYAIGPMDCIN